MVQPENFLDLYDIFVNELIGDPVLAVSLSLIVVIFFGVRNNMPWPVLIILVNLVIFIFVSKIFDAVVGMFTFAIFSIGFILYLPISRLFRRG